MPAPSLAEAPVGSRPIAVILSGGGAYGSWQGGALYRLAHGLKFHSVLGTSAGCLNGFAYFQNDLETLKSLWRDIARDRFLKFSPRLTPPHIFSQKTLRSFLERFVNEEKCRRERKCWFYAVSVDILNDGICQATYSPEDGGPWDSPLLDHIMGSISIPFVMAPVEIPATAGGKRKILFDGHVISFTALRPLIERGARDFLFLGVAGPTRHEGTNAGIAGMIHIVIHQLLRAQVANSMEAIAQAPPELGLRFFEFNPPRHLSLSVLGFKNHECRQGFDWGVEDGELFLKKPGDYLLR